MTKLTDCDYTIEETSEINNDLNKLSSIPNFPKAYVIFKEALPHLVCEREFYRSRGIFRISNLKCDCEAYIIKKIFCKGVGKDHFRATYIISGKIIRIVEIYSKNHKDIEDKERICKHC